MYSFLDSFIRSPRSVFFYYLNEQNLGRFYVGFAYVAFVCLARVIDSVLSEGMNEYIFFFSFEQARFVVQIMVLVFFVYLFRASYYLRQLLVRERPPLRAALRLLDLTGTRHS